MLESVRDSSTPADEGFGGKGETGFGCLRRASQTRAGSVRLGQGLCFGYAPVAWMGGVGNPCRWTPIAGCRWPSGLGDDTGRISQGGVGAGDGVEDGAREKEIGLLCCLCLCLPMPVRACAWAGCFAFGQVDVGGCAVL